MVGFLSRKSNRILPIGIVLLGKVYVEEVNQKKLSY